MFGAPERRPSLGTGLISRQLGLRSPFSTIQTMSAQVNRIDMAEGRDIGTGSIKKTFRIGKDDAQAVREHLAESAAPRYGSECE